MVKLFLLAAAATIVTPALAQTQSGTSMPDSATPGQPTSADPAQTQSGATQSMPATPADTANPSGTTSQAPMPAQSDSAMAQDGSGTPVGGYQPSGPAMTGTMTPGVTPIFRQAPSPDQAYPAPAPLAHYPMCKPGQFDNCMQGSGSTHSRQVHRRR